MKAQPTLASAIQIGNPVSFKKAVRALKWAVETMEDRYRQMSSVGVRSLAGFNDKVRAAKAKGQPLGRRVQTGYHPDTGQPQYEEEQLEFDAIASATERLVSNQRVTTVVAGTRPAALKPTPSRTFTA